MGTCMSRCWPTYPDPRYIPVRSRYLRNEETVQGQPRRLSSLTSSTTITTTSSSSISSFSDVSLCSDGLEDRLTATGDQNGDDDDVPLLCLTPGVSNSGKNSSTGATPISLPSCEGPSSPLTNTGAIPSTPKLADLLPSTLDLTELTPSTPILDQPSTPQLLPLASEPLLPNSASFSSSSSHLHYYSITPKDDDEIVLACSHEAEEEDYDEEEEEKEEEMEEREDGEEQDYGESPLPVRRTNRVVTIGVTGKRWGIRRTPGSSLPSLTELDSPPTTSIDLEWEPEAGLVRMSRESLGEEDGSHTAESSSWVHQSCCSTPNSLEWDFRASTLSLRGGNDEDGWQHTDMETEQLLHEIEQLAARALADTGHGLQPAPR